MTTSVIQITLGRRKIARGEQCFLEKSTKEADATEAEF